MSVIQNIKKIFRSYDFKGNRILNAKVNTPAKDEEIVNKKYADDLQKYNSTTVNTVKDSTTFSWMVGLAGLSIESILDKLFFHTEYQVFNNPILSETSYILKDVQLAFNTYIVFDGISLEGILSYVTTDNSRLPLTTSKIIVTHPDDSIDEFEDTNNSGSIEFNFIFSSNCTIVFERSYGPGIVTDEDTEIPEDFVSDYILTENITSKIIGNLNILTSPLISNDFITEQIFPTYTEETIPTLFTKTLHKTINDSDEIILDFLIPVELIDKTPRYKYPVKFLLFDENNIHLSTLIIPLTHLTKYTGGTSVSYNDIIYYKYQYNFGLLGINGKLMLDFSGVFNSEFIN